MNARNWRFRMWIAVGIVLLTAASFGTAQQTYQKPPQEILDVLNAPAPPAAWVSPARDYVLLGRAKPYPSISEVAQPMLRLAGIRINPKSNSPHLARTFTNFVLKRISDAGATPVALPANGKLSTAPEWSPDGKQIAFANTTETSVDLWIADLSGKTRKLGVVLNAAYGDPFRWMPDSKTILVQLIPANRGAAPVERAVPLGPNIQESEGKPAPIRTYEDMMQNPHDEALFDYYASAQLAFVDVATGKATPFGGPGIYREASISPDGQNLLVVRVVRPYSYLLPHSAFPNEVEIWDRSGKMIHKVASRPLADGIPIGGVQTGPRGIAWKPTERATLVWTEALDNGDPRVKVPNRDRILKLAAPFTGVAVEIAKTEHRSRGIQWIENDTRAFISDNNRDKRWNRTFLIDTSNPSATPRLVWSLNEQDQYNNPGSPVTRPLPNSQRVIQKSGDWILLTGSGASEQGDRPFLDRFNLATLKSERLYRCDTKSYESVVAVLSDDGARFLSRFESGAEPPNYLIRTVTSPGNTTMMALTRFQDPTPQLRKIQKQIVTYKREDGVDLRFTLYLPPDYKSGTRLPTVMWAYPTEYNDPSVAAQISGSSNRFTTITGPSHLFFALMGYAILDDASMPVIGDPQTVNNTYVQQIVMSAKAAIDKAAAMGVTDPNRVGVGGHSYGAFMTANLLAHSDLFRAGIARSGAYNRTLTPFGFQNERRTLWEAPETYLQMSPFLQADKIKEPILLIHGEADDNSGTFPIQSERMYQALKGNGATVRYVTLPNEAHGYAARESIEHTLYEMVTWFEKYVKDAPRK